MILFYRQQINVYARMTKQRNNVRFMLHVLTILQNYLCIEWTKELVGMFLRL